MVVIKMHHHPKHKNQLTPIFVIGAMKSGTTTLYNYMLEQDEICFASAKEPEYFSKKMGFKKYKSGDFWDLYNTNSNHKFVFDGSTGYTKYPAETGVPERIYNYGLRPKFIYVVRNPFDRIESHYNFMKRDLNWNGKIVSKYLIDVSNYYLQLSQYEKYFDVNDFLIIDFEDLTKKPKLVLDKISKHIGLSKINYKETNIISNVTKPVNRRELLYKKKLGGKFNFLPGSFRKLGKKAFSIVFVKKNNKLSKSQKEIIYEELKNDMNQFKSVYGFPVEKWGF